MAEDIVIRDAKRPEIRRTMLPGNSILTAHLQEHSSGGSSETTAKEIVLRDFNPDAPCDLLSRCPIRYPERDDG